MPKVDLSKIEEHSGSRYPDAFKRKNGDTDLRRWKGLTHGFHAFGANRVVMPPGAASSLQHYHTLEDELVIMLSGELILCTDEGETPMRAGDIAAFPANDGIGHCLVNRSAAEAVFVVVGNNEAEDVAYYSGINLKLTSEGFSPKT